MWLRERIGDADRPENHNGTAAGNPARWAGKALAAVPVFVFLQRSRSMHGPKEAVCGTNHTVIIVPPLPFKASRTPDREVIRTLPFFTFSR